MKKTKPLKSSILIAVILAFTMLAGCGSAVSTSPGKAGNEAASNSVTLKILFPGDPPRNLDAVNAAISEKLKADGLNIKLSYTFVPWDSYFNKQSLVVAAGESYDLAWSHVSKLSQSVSKNVLMPLDEILQTNGAELNKDISDFVWKAVQVNGKTYAIPRVVPSAQSDSFQIRGDLRKKYGLPEIKNSADFEKYLEAVKQNDPQMVPLVGGASGMIRELGPSNFMNGEYMNSLFYIDVNEKPLKVKNMFNSKFYEDFVNITRDWYKKGYLPKDPNLFKDVNGSFTQGKMAAMPSNILRPTEVIDALKTNFPEAELEFVQFAPNDPKYIFSSADNLLVVLATSKHPKEAVSFVNWLHSSQENYDLFTLGVKDVNYKVDGNSASYDGIPADKQYFPISWAWTDMRYHKFSKFMTPDQMDVIKNFDNGAIQTPLIGFAPDNEPVKAELAKLSAIVAEYSANGPLMNGQVDFSTVKDQFLSRLDAAGINKVLAEYQKQLDAFLAAQNKS
ncbi:extracellular solute-binding protein [Paenibacillus radicis (ex Gao et al. 2016)]|uniref:ABC transporter substrate-binding protein n=1 Tax=Paenibacillus radicis (ex Gao et al. 2016) TaxID=1737354 RepID=A0A917GNH6_9BACL|nr:extracellular solute-binding protein [Paenibacillus radicis (ex Gao et al. 2016)]GGG52206.1 ABC transporter substrate-binding protein [Paenibacillus radicis (ex Gao et al. 2016)]